jgi:hypothetical protein
VAELERETGLPKVTLPYLFAPRKGRDVVERLAEALAEQEAVS